MYRFLENLRMWYPNIIPYRNCCCFVAISSYAAKMWLWRKLILQSLIHNKERRVGVFIPLNSINMFGLSYDCLQMPMPDWVNKICAWQCIGIVSLGQYVSRLIPNQLLLLGVTISLKLWSASLFVCSLEQAVHNLQLSQWCVSEWWCIAAEQHLGNTHSSARNSSTFPKFCYRLQTSCCHLSVGKSTLWKDSRNNFRNFHELFSFIFI